MIRSQFGILTSLEKPHGSYSTVTVSDRTQPSLGSRMSMIHEVAMHELSSRPEHCVVRLERRQPGYENSSVSATIAGNFDGFNSEEQVNSRWRK